MSELTQAVRGWLNAQGVDAVEDELSRFDAGTVLAIYDRAVLELHCYDTALFLFRASGIMFLPELTRPAVTSLHYGDMRVFELAQPDCLPRLLRTIRSYDPPTTTPEYLAWRQHGA